MLTKGSGTVGFLTPFLGLGGLIHESISYIRGWHCI